MAKHAIYSFLSKDLSFDRTSCFVYSDIQNVERSILKIALVFLTNKKTVRHHNVFVLPMLFIIRRRLLYFYCEWYFKTNMNGGKCG